MMHKVRRYSWLWGLVIASIVLVQWLAFVHRIAHNPGPSIAHGLPHAKVDGTGKHSHSGHSHSIDIHHPNADHAHSWLDGFFAHQEGDITCHLQDALSAMDGGCMYKTAVHIAPPAILLVAFSQIMSTARAAALFEARGPPALS